MARHGNLQSPFQILSSQGVFALQNLFEASLCNNPASADLLRGQDQECDQLREWSLRRAPPRSPSFLDREGTERFDETIVISLMKSDAGFVEDIQHTGQSRSDLRGEPYSLGLSATECSAFAIKLQIAKADLI